VAPPGAVRVKLPVSESAGAPKGPVGGFGYAYVCVVPGAWAASTPQNAPSLVFGEVV